MSESPESPKPSDAPDAREANPKKRRTWLRLLLLAALLGGIYCYGKTSGFLDEVSVNSIRNMVEDAGAWGILLFIALFAAGVLAQVPGMLFVATGILVWGRATGFVVSLTGAIIAVCASFLMVRLVGGQAFGEVKRPFVRKLLAKLDDNPIRALILLRLVMFISPPLNYALALSRMKFRDYAIGSTIGLVVPMAVVTLAFDWLFATEWMRDILFT